MVLNSMNEYDIQGTNVRRRLKWATIFVAFNLRRIIVQIVHQYNYKNTKIWNQLNAKDYVIGPI